MTLTITDPLFGSESELHIENNFDQTLKSKMLEDIALMTEEMRELILSTMLKMHKEIEEYCGDLDLSLNTIEEIIENSESWYIVFAEDSTPEERIIKYNYRCDWETFHGVEVVIVNGDKVIFVGNCGIFYTLELFKKGNDEPYNYLKFA